MKNPKTIKRQTSVEWLFEKMIDSNHDDDLYEILTRAKEMNREEMRESYNQGDHDIGRDFDGYYNSIYNNTDTP